MRVLADRRIDVACVQERRWKSKGCRFFGTEGKRCQLFWMGSKEKIVGIRMFVAGKRVDSFVSVETMQGMNESWPLVTD